MKILYQDLLRQLEEKPSMKTLSERLFQLGHEHEFLGDILDMDITPNRGDCLSLNGLARDLNIFFGNSNSITTYNGDIPELSLDFQNLSPKDCPEITFLEIEIEKQSLSEYKSYLENYFSILGNKKTNFFTDVSNYISYELGQPTHCYDRNSLGAKLTFKKTKKEKTFTTLFGEEVKLEGDNCVFTVDNEIVNLAGVMGGEKTACSSETTKVLIECAYFNPESIIGKSVKYKLNSEAAHKFERGVDQAIQDKVLRRFIEIVADHTIIKSKKILSCVSNKFEHKYLDNNLKKINLILGTNITEIAYKKYLECLDFKIGDMIEVPSFRHDIQSQNDLAEEIARVEGYNAIKSTPFELKGVSNSNQNQKIRLIQQILFKHGFNEVINFPFSSKKEKQSISIDNPLDSNRQNLRITLKDSLVNNLLYNERRQKDSIKFYEISNIYLNSPKNSQQEKLGIIISGKQGHNYEDFSKKLDREYIFNLLESIIPKDLILIEEIPRVDIDTKRKEKIFYTEINLKDIPQDLLMKHDIENSGISFIKYNPISEFPSSSRDFSFLITDLSKVNLVLDLLEQINDDEIKKSFIFDFYKDNKTESIKIGFRIVFQSKLKTMSDKEIKLKIDKILAPLISIEGVSIPGM